MKKILIFLTIVWATFFPNLFYAHVVEPQFGCQITQHEGNSAIYEIGYENFILDILLEDLLDDDTNDSQRKKSFSGKIAHSNTFFIPHISAYKAFKNTLPANLFLPFRNSLFILLCEFRI